MLAMDLFHFEDVLVNSIYVFGMRSLARLLGGNRAGGLALGVSDVRAQDFSLPLAHLLLPNLLYRLLLGVK